MSSTPNQEVIVATPNPLDQQKIKGYFDDYLAGRYGDENLFMNAAEFTAHTDQHTDQHVDQHVDSPAPLMP